MATFTKRIAAANDDLWDRLQDGAWEARNTGETLGRFPDLPMGDVIYNLSLRFTNITIPKDSTINSATITFTSTNGGTYTVVTQIIGVAEDNTGVQTTSPISDARTRSHTTAVVNWTESAAHTIGGTYVTPDIKTIIQEIVNRAGWVSGNALGLYIYDNGTANNNTISQRAYENSTTTCALLTIDYTEPGGSPSPSPSPSLSPSASVSLSPSSSVSASPSASVSKSPSPSAPGDLSFRGIKIAKSGINVLETNEPQNLKFSSRYGTLKYFHKEAVQLQINGATGDFSGKTTYTHGLGYYPYTEVFVRVYIGSPSGSYEYCPFAGSGASVFYKANYTITPTTIVLYGEFNGISGSVWNFDFLIFVFKNNLFPT